MTIIRHMRFACWITKATNTHSECVIFIAFPWQQWLHERASMLRYTYIACLVCLNSQWNSRLQKIPLNEPIQFGKLRYCVVYFKRCSGPAVVGGECTTSQFSHCHARDRTSPTFISLPIDHNGSIRPVQH